MRISDNTLFFTIAVALVITFGIYNKNNSNNNQQPKSSKNTRNINEVDVEEDVYLTYNTTNNQLSILNLNPTLVSRSMSKTAGARTTSSPKIVKIVKPNQVTGLPSWKEDTSPVGSNSCKSLNNKQLTQVTLGCSGPENVGNMESCIQQTCSR